MSSRKLHEHSSIMPVSEWRSHVRLPIFESYVMNAPRGDLLILLSSIVLLWTVSSFRQMALFLRGWGRDHCFVVDNGGFFGSWNRVPEEWFDYEFIFTKYHESQPPTLVSCIFGYTPYPYISGDGFGIPLWVVFAVTACIYFLRRRQTDRLRRNSGTT